MENASSVLGAAWTEITAGVTAISGNDFSKLGIILLPPGFRRMVSIICDRENGTYLLRFPAP